MMDLIFEYLIVFILLFVTNIALLVRNIDFKSSKFLIFNLIYSLIVFVLSFALSSLNYQKEIIPYIPYLLGLVCILMLIFSIIHVKQGKFDKLGLNLENKLIPLIGTTISSFLAISALALGLNVENNLLPSIELAVLSFIVMFLVYKISRIFNKAKRPYYAVIGEYMFLEFIFLLILALTFSTVRELDYSIFKSFLILTPTYQLLYAIIIILIILVLGVLYSDWVLKRLKRK